jgi:hypothetical protein
VIGTYLAVVAVYVSSLAIGQAALSLCGVRRWSWLAPAVGLGLLCAICWATVRLPSHGTASAVVVLVLTVLAAFYLRGRLEGGGDALRAGGPVALIALLAASLPFLVEGHFGILGTGFNPDMSQHLLATDRLAHGETSQLLHQGYPLGPHSVVVALNKGLGIGIVQGFDGLTVAAAIIAPLTALSAFAHQSPPSTSAVPFVSYADIRNSGSAGRSAVAALIVGLPYLVASYYAQGAFKEVIQALFVLAFVLALRESTRTWRDLPLRYLPAALIAIGSVYVYSFPGLIWLGAIAILWAIAEYVSAKHASPEGGAAEGASPRPRRPVPRPADSKRDARPSGEEPSDRGDAPSAGAGPAGRRALSLAVLVLAIGTLPELGRMIDFHSFETFDPNGPGLGNLFGQISPFTALGIWPSGDFRLAPGDGAVPPFAYYLGAAFASLLLVYGLIQCVRRRETNLLAGVAAVALLYAAARLGGTPYTSAKALEIAAPLLTLAIVLPLVRRPVTTLYVLAAGACSLLALANAPVGPSSYSPALTGLRPLLAGGSTLVLAPDSLVADEQGDRYIAWELRGGRVCIEPASAAGGAPPVGVRYFITSGTSGAPFSQLRFRRQAGPYAVWERRGAVGGPSPCPLIAVRQARQGP